MGLDPAPCLSQYAHMGDSMTLAALQDLFRHHRDRATGLWKLGTEPSRTVFFDSGDIVFAQSTHTMDRLTFLLVERGKLTQAQMDYALANLKPGLSIGKNLIEMGFITQRDLLDVARAQVERVVQGAMGTPEMVPTFDARELDATVVRLPLDTPQLLLNGLLNLKDRERLLELLGPLNQVVVLQGNRLMGMSLPADLAKLPPLLDGTHTLLELSREALTEPLRLGTFALFLREIGWARLHEMPPLDRQALGLALTGEPEPLSPPLPEPLMATVPSLFSTIEAAARPTTNLEHLSHALDALPEPLDLFPLEETLAPESPLIPEQLRVPAPPSPMPDPSGFLAETGQALLPTPSMELPELPSTLDEVPEPEMTLRPSTMMVPPAEQPVFEASIPAEPAPKAKRGKGLLPGLSLLLLAALAAGGWWWFKIRPGSRTMIEVPPPVTRPVAPSTAVPTETGTPQPEPSKPGPPKAEPPKPEPSPVIGTSVQERVDALQKGDLELAIKQGQKYMEEGSSKQWTLRLEIACMGETLKRAVEIFPDGKPDLFIVPMTLRDGRTCYQVFYGKFPSSASAEKQAGSLPKALREGGNRPKVFRLGEIPNQQ